MLESVKPASQKIELSKILSFENIDLKNYDQNHALKEVSKAVWQQAIDQYFPVLRFHDVPHQYHIAIEKSLMEPNPTVETLTEAATIKAEEPLRTLTDQSEKALKDARENVSAEFVKLQQLHQRLYAEEPHVLFLSACTRLVSLLRKRLVDSKILKMDEIRFEYKDFFAKYAILGDLKKLWQDLIDKHFVEAKTQQSYQDDPEALFRKKFQDVHNVIMSALSENKEVAEVSTLLEKYDELILANNSYNFFLFNQDRTNCPQLLKLLLSKYGKLADKMMLERMLVSYVQDTALFLEILPFCENVPPARLGDPLSQAASTGNLIAKKRKVCNLCTY